MKGFITFLLLIYTFNKIESYVVEVNSLSFQPYNVISISPKGGYKDENGLKIRKYETTFSEPITQDNDISFSYICSDMNDQLRFTYMTTLCSANYNNFGGTIGAILAQSWGIDVSNGSICPTDKSPYQSESVFTVDNASLGNYAPELNYMILEIKDIEKRQIAKFRIWNDDSWQKQFS